MTIQRGLLSPNSFCYRGEHSKDRTIAVVCVTPRHEAIVQLKGLRDVRRSGGCCRSLTELIRKVRASGDCTFYLPLADTERVELQERWVVLS